MNKYKKFNLLKAACLMCLTIVFTTACDPDHEDAVPATLPTTPEVFIDGFSAGLDFQAFGDSKVSAFQVDSEITYEKSDASMRFDVPNAADPEGGYAGGIFFDDTGRDLSNYNVLSFWGRASQAATIQELGFGLRDTEVFRTSINNVAFSTAWTQYFIILPDPSKLTEEEGIFYFVDTPDNGNGYSFWIDDLKYENLETVGQLQPVFQNGNATTLQAFVGQVLAPSGLGLRFSLPNGVDQPVSAAPAYFSLSSSTEAASIRLNPATNVEEIVVQREGEAVITATLGDIDAEGSLTLNVSEFEPAPIPTRDSSSVISIFSDAYENRPVDFYNGFYAPFQTTESADFTVNGDNVLNYINYNFVGIEFNQNVPTIDGNNMTHLHVDIYIPDDFDPASTLRINLRDFGADASFDGGDDAIVSLVLSANTTPALVKGQWIGVDFDLSGLVNKNNLGQIVFDAETNESPRPNGFFVDNIYLYNEDGSTGGGDPILPSEPAPAPTQMEADVISIYSDAYTDVPNIGFNLYGNAAFEEVQIQNQGALKYTLVATDGGNFQVIELGENQLNIEAAGMTNFRFDAWFSNPVGANTSFLMKVVDIPAAGVTEAQINVNASSNPAIAQGQWLSFDIPVSELATNGLGGQMNIQQVVIDLMSSGEVYLDNIYFYRGDGMGSNDPILPTEPAPTPSQAEADVISIYSDAYTDAPKDGFNFYGAAAFEEVQLQGNGALKYTFVETDGGNFQVIELGGNQLDVETAGMTNFRFDAWFSNAVDMNTTFLLKVVDISMSGATEAQINVNASSNPPLAQGEWLSFDIPITELESNGLGGKMNIQQVVIDLMNSGEVYLDNIYFYKEPDLGGNDPILPTEPAPTPTQAEADVISIYSNAYTDAPKDGFNFYGAAAFEELQIQGDGALKYTFVDVDGGNFQVIELGGNQQDVETAGMTNFRFDAWFPNAVDMNTTFLLKVVDISMSGATEAQINVNASSNPPIAQGEWLSFDIPITELESNGLGGKMNIQQVVIDLMNAEEVYLDNIYFYKEPDMVGGPILPTVPAPTPTQAEADVISIYSDAYTDAPRDGFNFYGAAAFEEVQIQGDGALKYTFVDVGGGNFQVIELGGNQLNVEAAGMTNFRFDAWFPNEVDMNTTFLLKVVDISMSGATEAQINVNASSNPVIDQGVWLSFDIPITELENNGLGGKMNIQQVVVDLMNSGEVYLDNIYFYK